MASDQKVAVVTGAAGGLGACFARKLAELDYELILIDRREDDVNRLCGELRSISNTKVEPIAADLCDNEAVAELARRLAALPHIELLINNAGFGFSQDFVDVEIQRHIDMIALHVMTPASLTHAVLPRMIERNRGVQYCSTKAYLVSFSESLQDELRGTKLRVQALCPGFIHTGFHDRDGMSHLDIGKIPKWLWVTTDEAVKCSLQNLSRRQVIVIPGFLPRILGRCMRMPMLQPLVRALSRQPRRDDKNAATR
jgi:short-subunit dehydrogenase